MSSKRVVLNLEHVSKTFSADINRARRNTFRRIIAAPFMKAAGPQPGEFAVLKDISLKVTAGERVVLIGHPGSGKSALFRILCGLSPVTGGSVSLSGPVRLVQGKPVGDRPLMTLKQYIGTLASLFGAKYGTYSSLVEEVLHACNLEGKAGMRVKELTPRMMKDISYYTSLTIPADLYLFDDIPLGRFPELEGRIYKEGTLIRATSTHVDLNPDYTRAVILHGGWIHYDGNMSDAREVFHLLPPVQPSPLAPVFSDDEDEEADGLGPVEVVGVAEAPPAAAPVETFVTKTPPPRKGSGVIRFSEVRFRNRQGAELATARTGEPVVIELDYEVYYPNVPFEKISSVTVIFTDEKGQRVFGMPSEILGLDFPRAGAAGTFRCEVPVLPLLPGKYGLIVSILLDGQLADKMVNEAFLDVESAELLPPRAFGAVKVPFTFEHHPI